MPFLPFLPLPATASWLHQEARTGYEVAYFHPADDGLLLVGCTTALQDGLTWVVDYEIEVDARWTTRRARIGGLSVAGSATVTLDQHEDGRWLVNGANAPELDGCLDVDLESSAMTNTLPVHRLALEPGRHASAPSAFVRATDLAVERLEQTYLRTGAEQRYRYTAPGFGFTSDLEYDERGLVVHYPGIAVRSY